MFQEDISKLRIKIEKAKKPAEKISNGDDILNEEINDYKVRFCGPVFSEVAPFCLRLMVSSGPVHGIR